LSTSSKICLPHCSISLWSDLIREISAAQCVKQRRKETRPRHLEKITSGHAHFAAGFRNEDEIASSNFEEQVEEICLAESGGPGLGSVRQSLFVLIDPA
jgi:hypothetical protein